MMRPLWVPAGTFSGDFFAVQGGDGELVAQRGLGDVDRHLEQQVVALALEEAVRLDVQHHVQMAGDAAARGGLALAVQAQLDALVGALRDLDRHGLSWRAPRRDPDTRCTGRQ